MQSEKGGKHNKPHIHALYGDYEYFKRVSTDGFTVVWPDGQDICPDELYDMWELVS